jgi:hypothetical protein
MDKATYDMTLHQPCSSDSWRVRTLDNAINASIDVVGLVVDQSLVRRPWSLVPWLMMQRHLVASSNHNVSMVYQICPKSKFCIDDFRASY